MKKSSLLHNPKDMLSRSFKPAKLKTSLKLATSRMKLMKNKKEVQLNQMKRELAQLLESGQAQTARIRVEHVIREEKMKAAYELLEIYSELIVARLPIMESQKACPIDLKEAITSVIFASRRCGEIPELMDAQKQLTTKYGKEFASAAIEMRPNCGVSRLMIEKLSAGAPDLQTKMKTLAKIAEEHNIKWDSTTMGCIEPPPEDLLNGPKTFEAGGVVHKAPPTPNYQAPPSPDPVDYYAQQNVRPSPVNHEYTHGHDSFSRNTASSIPQDQRKPHGIRQEKDQVSGETSQREGSSSINGQSWDMEFKDAASAARAAAESAERATMAAKAAAEFSSRVQDAREPQHTSKVHNSVGDSSGDQGSRKHGNLKPTSDYISQDSVRSNVSEKLPRFQKDLPDDIEQENRNRSSKRSDNDGHTAGNGYVNTTSSRSEASVQNIGHGVHVRAGNHPKEDEIRTESSMQRQSGNFEIKGKDHLRDSFDAETFAYHREGTISKQSSGRSVSSRSKASGSDDEFSNYGIFGNDAGSGPFVGKDERASSYTAADAPVTFDDSGSDGEDFGPTLSFNVNKESDLHFGSPSRSPPSNLHTFSGNESLIHTSRRSPLSSKSEYSPKFSEREEASPKKHSFAEFSDREESSHQKNSFAEFSERVESSPRKQSSAEFSKRVEATPVYPQEDTFGSVTFDDSDGSESDTDVFPSKHDTVEDVSRQKHSLEFSDSQIRRNDNRKTETFGSGRKTETFGNESPVIPSSSRLGKSQQEFSDSVKDDKKHVSSHSKDTGSSPHSHGENLDDEDSDDGRELKFNLLTGGFRHKGYLRPPYTKAQEEDTTHSSSRVSDKGRASIKQSTAASTVERFTNTKREEHNGRSSRVPDNDSDRDSTVEDVKQPLNLRRKQKDVRDGNTQTQSKLRGSSTYFDSESEDDSAVQVKTGNSQQVGGGISRRTKVSPPSSRPKAGSSSRVNDFESERTQTSRTHGTETPEEYLQRKRTPSNRTHGKTETLNSDHRRKSEQATKDHLDSRTSTPEEKSKPSVVQPPVRAEPKAEKPENQKAPPSKATIEREDNSKNRPSHVHPKLPDFDSLAARLDAIRMNRQ